MKFNSNEIQTTIASAKKLVRESEIASRIVLSIKDEIRSAADRRADDLSNNIFVGEISDDLIRDLRDAQKKLCEADCALAEFELLNGPVERWIERGWILLAKALLEEKNYPEVIKIAKERYFRGEKSEALSISKGLSKRGVIDEELLKLLSR